MRSLMLFNELICAGIAIWVVFSNSSAIAAAVFPLNIFAFLAASFVVIFAIITMFACLILLLSLLGDKLDP